MFAEIEELVSLGSQELAISANIISLTPFPGTPVLHRHLDLVDDPEQFRFFDHDYYWGWKRSLGQQLHLLDQFALMGHDRYRRRNFVQSGRVNRLVAREAFSERQELASAAQREHMFGL